MKRRFIRRGWKRAERNWKKLAKRERGSVDRWRRAALKQIYREAQAARERELREQLEKHRAECRAALGPLAPLVDILAEKYPEVWLRAYRHPNGDVVIDLLVERGQGKLARSVKFSQFQLDDAIREVTILEVMNCAESLASVVRIATKEHGRPDPRV